MANEQISLPYFVGVLVFAGLVIRYLFFSGTSAAQPAARSPEAFLRSREAAVERIQQMFPQSDRRCILWDLQRNGGNIQGTTERILAGRLETPPVTFQPPPPPGQSASAQSASSTPQPDRQTQPDLITRYNLKDKLGSAVPGSGGSSSSSRSNDAKGNGWSSNREERQVSLQRRRDDMILAARQKMQAKMAAEKAAAGTQ